MSVDLNKKTANGRKNLADEWDKMAESHDILVKQTQERIIQLERELEKMIHEKDELELLLVKYTSIYSR